MIGALITFLVLYGLLYGLERQRTEVDGFSIATVACVPVLLTVFVTIILGMFYRRPLALAVVPLATLLVATFLLLRKMMELPAGRSAAYTAVVFVLNVGLSLLLVRG
jgi:hypothetical protein